MLVLSRKVGETIVINNDIKIHFLSPKKAGKFRVGIEAPKEIKIDREEQLEKMSQKDHL